VAHVRLLLGGVCVQVNMTFTCFTSTKVQILTPVELRALQRWEGAAAGSSDKSFALTFRAHELYTQALASVRTRTYADVC
jgi:hypothetical protein